MPESFRAVTAHKDETDISAGRASADKDPCRSLHIDDVASPELGPGEALVTVMASAISYNTVWTSIFEPIPTFEFRRVVASYPRWRSGTTCRTTSSAPTSLASRCARTLRERMTARR
jgi:hypothetical protein